MSRNEVAQETLAVVAAASRNNLFCALSVCARLLLLPPASQATCKRAHFTTISCGSSIAARSIRSPHSIGIVARCRGVICNTSNSITRLSECSASPHASTCCYCFPALSAQVLQQKAAPSRVTPSFKRKNRREQAGAGHRILFLDQWQSEHAAEQNDFEHTWMQDRAASPMTFLQQL